MTARRMAVGSPLANAAQKQAVRNKPTSEAPAAGSVRPPSLRPSSVRPDVVSDDRWEPIPKAPSVPAELEISSEESDAVSTSDLRESAQAGGKKPVAVGLPAGNVQRLAPAPTWSFDRLVPEQEPDDPAARTNPGIGGPTGNELAAPAPTLLATPVQMPTPPETEIEENREENSKETEQSAEALARTEPALEPVATIEAPAVEAPSNEENHQDPLSSSQLLEGKTVEAPPLAQEDTHTPLAENLANPATVEQTTPAATKSVVAKKQEEVSAGGAVLPWILAGLGLLMLGAAGWLLGAH